MVRLCCIMIFVCFLLFEYRIDHYLARIALLKSTKTVIQRYWQCQTTCVSSFP